MTCSFLLYNFVCAVLVTRAVRRKITWYTDQESISGVKHRPQRMGKTANGIKIVLNLVGLPVIAVLFINVVSFGLHFFYVPYRLINRSIGK